mgnify:CR=1 FL=1
MITYGIDEFKRSLDELTKYLYNNKLNSNYFNYTLNSLYKLYTKNRPEFIELLFNYVTKFDGKFYDVSGYTVNNLDFLYDYNTKVKNFILKLLKDKNRVSYDNSITNIEDVHNIIKIINSIKIYKNKNLKLPSFDENENIDL